MKAVVDITKVRNNIKEVISNKLFNWFDIRKDFYHHGINLIEEIVKNEKIGLYIDDINNALKIRNIYKNIPIILTKIDNNDQIYDVIMNNIILSIDDIELFNKLVAMDLNDKIQLAIRIDINNYEQGVSIKSYLKIKEVIKKNKYIDIYLLYAKVINSKYDSLTLFEQLINKNQVSSFVIGKEVDFASDGFISKEMFNDAIEYKITVDKCYKLNKGMIFVNKKIKKDCYGVKIVVDNIDLLNIKSLMIDNVKYKTIFYNDDTLFLIGKDSVKSNKVILLPKNIVNNKYIDVPTIYKLNDKTMNYTIFE